MTTNRWLHYLAILLAVLVAYWQLTTMHYSLQWDALDCWLPWRFFISESLASGEIPLWNPYQQLGYPIHADLQGPIWNPESFLIGLTLGHSLYTLIALFLLYVTLGGIGFYELCKFLGSHPVAALSVAIAYSLSGFFVSHSQHFFSIISGAWIPWLVLYYLKLCTSFSFRHSIKAAILFFLQLTAGNQTFTFIFIYLLFGLFVVKAISLWRQGEAKQVRPFVSANLLFAICSILLAAVTLVCLVQTLPHIGRLKGMTLSQAAFNPFSPQSLTTLFIPYIAASNGEWFQTDISMCNGYFGLIPLLFFVNSLFSPKSSLQWIFLIFGTICYVASLGLYTPFYKIINHYLPFINLFRFPSYFFHGSIFCILVLASLEISEWLKSDKFLLGFKLLIGIVALGLCSVIVYAYDQTNSLETTLWLKSKTRIEFITLCPFYVRICLHGLIQLGIIALFISLILSKKPKLLPLLVFAEMFISVQLTTHTTTSMDCRPKFIQDIVSAGPKGFPIPSLLDTIGKNTDGATSAWPLWRNTSVYQKKVAPGGFNSFWLAKNYYLNDSLPQLGKASINNPLVFLTDSVFDIQAVPDSINPATDNRKVYLIGEDLNNLNPSQYKVSASDKIEISGFKPNKITLQTSTVNPTHLVLLQSNYPGWVATVDGKTQAIYTANVLFVSTSLPKGRHTVILEYKNPMVMAGFAISYFSFFGMLVLLALNSKGFIKL